MIAFAFLRWLTRFALRVLLKDRVRIRKVGSRGIAGLHFKQHGFADARGAGEGKESLSVKVQQVTLRFNGFASRIEGEEKESDQSKKTPVKAWFTIRVRGVGIQLSKAPEDGSAHKGKHKPHRSPPREPDHTPKPPPPASSWTAVQAARGYAILAARPLLYLIASGLPILTRCLDLGIDRIEVFLEDQGVVARVAHVRLGLQVQMKASKQSSSKTSQQAYHSEASGLRRTSLDETTTMGPDGAQIPVACTGPQLSKCWLGCRLASARAQKAS
jgi:hypothetical protein